MERIIHKGLSMYSWDCSSSGGINAWINLALPGSDGMATLSEANALQKLLRRKFRPQMRWWMQKLHKPSNQRGARMGWKERKSM